MYRVLKPMGFVWRRWLPGEVLDLDELRSLLFDPSTLEAVLDRLVREGTVEKVEEVKGVREVGGDETGEVTPPKTQGADSPRGPGRPRRG